MKKIMSSLVYHTQTWTHCRSTHSFNIHMIHSFYINETIQTALHNGKKLLLKVNLLKYVPDVMLTNTADTVHIIWAGSERLNTHSTLSAFLCHWEVHLVQSWKWKTVWTTQQHSFYSSFLMFLYRRFCEDLPHQLGQFSIRAFSTNTT